MSHFSNLEHVCKFLGECSENHRSAKRLDRKSLEKLRDLGLASEKSTVPLEVEVEARKHEYESKLGSASKPSRHLEMYNRSRALRRALEHLPSSLQDYISSGKSAFYLHPQYSSPDVEKNLSEAGYLKGEGGNWSTDPTDAGLLSMFLAASEKTRTRRHPDTIPGPSPYEPKSLPREKNAEEEEKYARAPQRKRPSFHPSTSDGNLLFIAESFEELSKIHDANNRERQSLWETFRKLKFSNEALARLSEIYREMDALALDIAENPESFDSNFLRKRFDEIDEKDGEIIRVALGEMRRILGEDLLDLICFTEPDMNSREFARVCAEQFLLRCSEEKKLGITEEHIREARMFAEKASRAKQVGAGEGKRKPKTPDMQELEKVRDEVKQQAADRLLPDWAYYFWDEFCAVIGEIWDYAGEDWLEKLSTAIGMFMLTFFLLRSGQNVESDNMNALEPVPDSVFNVTTLNTVFMKNKAAYHLKHANDATRVPEYTVETYLADVDKRTRDLEEIERNIGNLNDQIAKNTEHIRRMNRSLETHHDFGEDLTVLRKNSGKSLDIYTEDAERYEMEREKAISVASSINEFFPGGKFYSTLKNAALMVAPVLGSETLRDRSEEILEKASVRFLNEFYLAMDFTAEENENMRLSFLEAHEEYMQRLEALSSSQSQEALPGESEKGKEEETERGGEIVSTTEDKLTSEIIALKDQVWNSLKRMDRFFVKTDSLPIESPEARTARLEREESAVSFPFPAQGLTVQASQALKQFQLFKFDIFASLLLEELQDVEPDAQLGPFVPELAHNVAINFNSDMSIYESLLTRYNLLDKRALTEAWARESAGLQHSYVFTRATLLEQLSVTKIQLEELQTNHTRLVTQEAALTAELKYDRVIKAVREEVESSGMMSNPNYVPADVLDSVGESANGEMYTVMRSYYRASRSRLSYSQRMYDFILSQTNSAVGGVSGDLSGNIVFTVFSGRKYANFEDLFYCLFDSFYDARSGARQIDDNLIWATLQGFGRNLIAAIAIATAGAGVASAILFHGMLQKIAERAVSLGFYSLTGIQWDTDTSKRLDFGETSSIPFNHRYLRKFVRVLSAPARFTYNTLNLISKIPKKAAKLYLVHGGWAHSFAILGGILNSQFSEPDILGAPARFTPFVCYLGGSMGALLAVIYASRTALNVGFLLSTPGNVENAQGVGKLSAKKMALEVSLMKDKPWLLARMSAYAGALWRTLKFALKFLPAWTRYIVKGLELSPEEKALHANEVEQLGKLQETLTSQIFYVMQKVLLSFIVESTLRRASIDLTDTYDDFNREGSEMKSALEYMATFMTSPDEKKLLAEAAKRFQENSASFSRRAWNDAIDLARYKYNRRVLKAIETLKVRNPSLFRPLM